MSNPPDLHDLASQPEYFLNDVNLDAGDCGFLKLDKGAHRRSAFMDRRIQGGSDNTVRAPLALMQEIVAEVTADTKPTRINYILHTAFCCSTLITRCLDIEGICCALREPAVLMQLANYKRGHGPIRSHSAEWSRLLDTVLFLLAKSKVNAEQALIKPTNAANNLGEDLLRQPRTGGVLLLYSSLEQFLVSILKKGEAGRIFVRRLFNVIRGDSNRAGMLSNAAMMRLTDLQIAAFVWYLQIDMYLHLLEVFPQANIRTLDCETFLATPATTLAKLCGLFSLDVGIDSLQQIVLGPVFRKSAKDNTQDYDSALRQTEYAEIMRLHQADIAGIVSWCEGIRPEGPIRLPLPRAL